MFSVYDKCEITFNNGVNPINFPYCVDLRDYEDTFIIETVVAIDDMKRGWIGDVRIVLRGNKIDDWNKKVVDVVLYKDVLCYRHTIEISDTHPVTYKYMFMKY